MVDENEFLPVAGERTPIGDTGAVIAGPRPIQLRALNHIAIRVNELEKAEAFYTSFFGMTIIGRANRGPKGGYHPVATDYDPETAYAANHEADVTFLRSEAMTFVLRRMGRGDRVETNAVLDHISVDVDIHGFAELRGEVLMRNFDVLMLAPEALTFRDPFGVVWEVTLDDAGDGLAGV